MRTHSRQPTARWLGAAMALLAGGALAAPPEPAGALKLERIVLVMRHGVRPPTREPPVAPGIAADPWPQWSVPPGWLTAHGAEGVRLLGASDRALLVHEGLLPTRGCPTPGSLTVHSDSDQRTIATGDAWLGAFAPGCAQLSNEHLPQDEPDALFAHADDAPGFDPARANAATAQALGTQGIPGVEASQHEALATLDRILCGTRTADCGVSRQATSLAAAKDHKAPELRGALDLASTLSQVLVLEYAEGLPLAQVGWGRATAQDIQTTGSLHSTKFLLLSRPGYLAAGNSTHIGQLILTTLGGGGADQPAIVALMGHDTQVASLGGLLDLHWQVPGYAADDPPPGGALLFERLRDAKGAQFVRVRVRAQSLEQLRALSPLDKTGPYLATLTIGGCGTLCPLGQLQQILSRQLAR